MDGELGPSIRLLISGISGVWWVGLPKHPSFSSRVFFASSPDKAIAPFKLFLIFAMRATKPFVANAANVWMPGFASANNTKRVLSISLYAVAQVLPTFIAGYLSNRNGIDVIVANVAGAIFAFTNR
jgi:hypothetical protein